MDKSTDGQTCSLFVLFFFIIPDVQHFAEQLFLNVP